MRVLNALAARGRMATLLLLVADGMMVAFVLALSKRARLDGFPPLATTFWIFFGAAVLLAPLAAANVLRARATPGCPPHDWRRCCRYGLVAGILGLSGPTALVILAVPHVGVGLASVAYTLPPMLTWLLMLALGRTAFSIPQGMGTLLALAGLLLLALPEAGARGGPGLVDPWLLLLLCPPLMLAAGNIYRSAVWPAGERPMTLAGYVMGGAAASMLPLMILLEGLPWPAPVLGAPGGAAGLWTVWAGMGVTAAMYITHMIVQARAGPVYISRISYIIVGTGIVTGVAVYGESLPPGTALALPLLAAGMWLSGRRMKMS